NGGARDLELLGQLALGGKLIAGTQIAFLQKTLDLLDDPLIEPAPPDGLDDGHRRPPAALVRWSDQIELQPKAKPKSASSRRLGWICEASTWLTYSTRPIPGRRAGRGNDHAEIQPSLVSRHGSVCGGLDRHVHQRGDAVAIASRPHERRGELAYDRCGLPDPGRFEGPGRGLVPGRRFQCESFRVLDRGEAGDRGPRGLLEVLLR